MRGKVETKRECNCSQLLLLARLCVKMRGEGCPFIVDGDGGGRDETGLWEVGWDPASVDLRI